MGSYSIKNVQPVLAPHLDYEALGDVKDGLSAQFAYLEAVSANCTEARRAELKKKLEDHCALDTLSMVEVARRLASGPSNRPPRITPSARRRNVLSLTVGAQ